MHYRIDILRILDIRPRVKPCCLDDLCNGALPFNGLDVHTLNRSIRGGSADWIVDDVEEAVRRTSEASGLGFEFDGVVHRSVADLLDAGSFVTEAPGGLRWSPVLIAFRSRSAMRDVGVRHALGVAFPVTSRFDAEQFVSGVVVINASAQLEEAFGRAPSVGEVVQHELGHTVGGWPTSWIRSS